MTELVAVMKREEIQKEKERENETQLLVARASILQEEVLQQHSATHCNTLQHTATHCNTLQHTVTLSSTLIYMAKR